MPARKTSASGAYMSQYDNEVEGRLKALEAEVKSLRAQCDSHNHPSSGGGNDEKLNLLIDILKRDVSLNIEKLSKGLL